MKKLLIALALVAAPFAAHAEDDCSRYADWQLGAELTQNCESLNQINEALDEVTLQLDIINGAIRAFDLGPKLWDEAVWWAYQSSTPVEGLPQWEVYAREAFIPGYAKHYAEYVENRDAVIYDINRFAGRYIRDTVDHPDNVAAIWIWISDPAQRDVLEARRGAILPGAQVLQDVSEALNAQQADLLDQLNS